MKYDIIALPKEQWKGTVIPLTTRSDSYYDFELSPLNHEGCTVSLIRDLQRRRLFIRLKNMISPIRCIRIIGKGRKLRESRHDT